MSYMAHQYSRVDIYSSVEVNLSKYYDGVVVVVDYGLTLVILRVFPNIFSEASGSSILKVI